MLYSHSENSSWKEKEVPLILLEDLFDLLLPIIFVAFVLIGD